MTMDDDDWMDEWEDEEHEPEGLDSEPDWTSKCENCGDSPVVRTSGLCGPCTFGDASTVGGNW